VASEEYLDGTRVAAFRFDTQDKVYIQFVERPASNTTGDFKV
jgi:hypothetical protein